MPNSASQTPSSCGRCSQNGLASRAADISSADTRARPAFSAYRAARSGEQHQDSSQAVGYIGIPSTVTSYLQDHCHYTDYQQTRLTQYRARETSAPGTLQSSLLNTTSAPPVYRNPAMHLVSCRNDHRCLANLGSCPRLWFRVAIKHPSCIVQPLSDFFGLRYQSGGSRDTSEYIQTNTLRMVATEHGYPAHVVLWVC